MSKSKRHKLDQLPDRSNTPITAEYDNGAASAEVELASVDRIGCAANRVKVTGPSRSTQADNGKVHAQEICRRVNYLDEPLAVIESDADAQATQVRSVQPQTDEEGSRHYYELRVGDSQAELQRYRSRPHEARETEPIELTRQTLRRLAKDLTDVYGS